MTRTSAVRLGIPLRRIATRILVPIGLLLFLFVAGLSYREAGSLQRQMTVDHRAGVRTIFETSPAVQADDHGLTVLARNRGFERVWVLSATGDILDSNRPAEIGQRLDARWWDLVRNQSSGLRQKEVRFGDQQLMVTSLNSVEDGRNVVIVSRPISVFPSWIFITGLLLGLSLIMWMVSAGIVTDTLQRTVSKPLHKIDERLFELLRKGTIAPAALDRLWAETEKQLGGHSDTVIDLARMTRDQGNASDLYLRQFRTLFDTVPSWVLLRGPDGRIVDCNDSLANGTGINRQWMGGRPLALLSEVLPVDRLEAWFANGASSRLGVRRLRIDNASVMGERHSLLLTISPFPIEDGTAHLIIMEDVTVLDQTGTNDSDAGLDAFMNNENEGDDQVVPSGAADPTLADADIFSTDPTLFDDVSSEDASNEATRVAGDRAPNRIQSSTDSVSMVPDSILALFRGEEPGGSSNSARIETTSSAPTKPSSPSASSAPPTSSKPSTPPTSSAPSTLPTPSSPSASSADRIESISFDHAMKHVSGDGADLDATLDVSEASGSKANKEHGGTETDVTGAKEQDALPQSTPTSFALADQVLSAIGHFAVAFNENGQTIYWSPAGCELTGYKQEEIGDLQQFTKLIFPHSKERKLFMQWLDSDPDERSQELKVRTINGIVPARWQATEIETADSGPVGVLWASFAGAVTTKSTPKGEPPLQERNS